MSQEEHIIYISIKHFLEIKCEVVKQSMTSINENNFLCCTRDFLLILFQDVDGKAPNIDKAVCLTSLILVMHTP